MGYGGRSGTGMVDNRRNGADNIRPSKNRLASGPMKPEPTRQNCSLQELLLED